MSHLALYREFRPKTFDEVVGQDHIVKTLKHQIQTNSVSHAYLFCGTRGTGKTSSAKIFAKAVNCLSPKNGSPCGECEVCKKIDSNGNLDIIEIDAASNNRVDEIRDLREKVGYLPTIGKYKVYIIDEVHMLTDSAFNALLKTLEEPPSHIIFILATTEPEKLPATILSRCMRFDFKLVTIDALATLLENIFQKVGTKYETDALKLIAKAGNGSVRDTLSVAEMCKAYAENNVTYSSVIECLGLADDNIIYQISKAITQKNGGEVLRIIDNLYKDGKNLNVVVTDLCEFFRNTLTLKLTKDFDLDVPSNIKENYLNIANDCNEKFLLDILKKLCDGMTQVRFASNQKVFTETLLLSLFYDENLELQILKDRLAKLESGTIFQNNSLKNNIDAQKSEHKIENNLSNTPVQNSLIGDKNPFTEDQEKNSSSEQPIQSNFAKQIFGEFIGYTRNSGEMLLLAGLNDIKGVDIQNGKFVFCCVNSDAKEMIESHRNFILEFLTKHNITNFEATILVDKQKEIENELSNLLDGKLKIED